MGLYINGIGNTTEEKIAWLNENAWLKRVSNGDEEVNFDFGHHAQKDRRIVCIVDNGAFAAVGVAFDEQELNRFMIADGRPKGWYVMAVGKIKEMCPDWEDYFGEEI